ncbi:uncharacterized protein LOC143275484 [Babylonia areolata]|uniref:uncharacterized protein LOC143275484 n=1 Tax=Babylonia areolata TaxID=304850 RepID=UPI003FCFFB0F
MCLTIVPLSLLVWAVSAVSQLEEMSDYKNHPCVRPCTDGAPPMRCEYRWTVELYYTLSKACFLCPFNLTDCSRPHCVPADGTSRAVLTVNRALPGPGVQVCEGDEVIVHVRNAMDTAAGTTIHWHGHRQRGTQLMDGVSLVTQCPITPMATFRYRFKADDPGTHWWHSHSGLQRSNGLYGPFVVRQPPSRDPHSALYDLDLPEHVMLLADWLPELTESRFPAHHHDDGDNKPSSMLINGKGAFAPLTHPDTGNTTHNQSYYYTPYAEFKVSPGLRYRFRVISAAFLNCPIQFSVDSHNLTVIATDGSSIEPVEVESVNLFAGERFDVVLKTLDQASASLRNYWIRARGLADCGEKEAHQVAVLRYEGSAQPPAAAAAAADDDTLKETPDRKFYVAMEFNKVDNFHFDHPELYPLSALPREKQFYSPQLNHISFILPSAPPLTQFEDLDEEAVFCSTDSVQTDCRSQFCECTHRLKVGLGEVVELIIIDEGVTFNVSHPMHLHGYRFRVIGMDKLNDSTSLSAVQALDEQGLLRRRLRRAVYKDTVTVPDGGYTIVRFKADNPGVWMLHCHMEFHNAAGMGLVMQVGEASQFPPRPARFPTCGRRLLTQYNKCGSALYFPPGLCFPEVCVPPVGQPSVPLGLCSPPGLCSPVVYVFHQVFVPPSSVFS